MVAKLILCCTFLSLSFTWIAADEISIENIVAYRKLFSEQEILQKLRSQQLTVRGNLQHLKEAGFSDDFIAALENINDEEKKQQSSPKVTTKTSEKLHKIHIEIQPPGAGRVLIEPVLEQTGQVADGTEVYLLPQANSPYLFDHWQGDLVGYHPLRFQVKQDIRLTAVFSKPKKFSPPPKINDSQKFKDTRKAGYTYYGEVVGVVSGQGQNKDWGIEAQMDYKYAYYLSYTGRVESNDGFRIRERRTFDSVNEVLTVSKYSLRLNVREDLDGIIEFTKDAGEVISSYGVLAKDPQTFLAGSVITGGAKLTDLTLRAAEKFSVSGEKVEQIFESLGNKFDSPWIKDWKKRLKDPRLGRVIAYAPQMEILEGKTFILEYEDGVGLVHVETTEEIMTTQERELLERAFYLSDYFIFRDSDNPGHSIKVGDKWDVDAKNLAGSLDPRLRHEVEGKVALRRGDDIDKNGKNQAVFHLQNGKVALVGRDNAQKTNGYIDFREGKIVYDLEMNYVSRADISGVATYNELSTDHLLFGARLFTTPQITANYRCTCRKTEK